MHDCYIVKARRPGSETWEDAKLLWSKDRDRDGDVEWKAILVFLDMTVTHYEGFTPVSSLMVNVRDEYYLNTDEFTEILEGSFPL